MGSVFAQDTGDLSALRQDALTQANALRAEAEHPELGPSEFLDEQAQGHATDMLVKDCYGRA